MGSDTSSPSGPARERARPGVLVGKTVTVRPCEPAPSYFTDTHRRWIGERGRVHAVVAGQPRDNPLVKVGFDAGTQIVFFRLRDLEVDPDGPADPPRRHGARGSHLPGGDRSSD